MTASFREVNPRRRFEYHENWAQAPLLLADLGQDRANKAHIVLGTNAIEGVLLNGGGVNLFTGAGIGDQSIVLPTPPPDEGSLGVQFFFPVHRPRIENYWRVPTTPSTTGLAYEGFLTAPTDPTAGAQTDAAYVIYNNGILSAQVVIGGVAEAVVPLNSTSFVGGDLISIIIDFDQNNRARFFVDDVQQHESVGVLSDGASLLYTPIGVQGAGDQMAMESLYYTIGRDLAGDAGAVPV